MERNWVSCNLGDIVFIPYGVKGSKTYTAAKKIAKKGIPVFTTDSPVNKDLHDAGIPGYNRKTVREYLEKYGAKIWVEQSRQNDAKHYEASAVSHSFVKDSGPKQQEFFNTKSKGNK